MSVALEISHLLMPAALILKLKNLFKIYSEGALGCSLQNHSKPIYGDCAYIVMIEFISFINLLIHLH
jgi:hypothetical protein